MKKIITSYAGKQANEKLKNKIIEDADSQLTKGVVKDIKDNCFKQRTYKRIVDKL